MMFMQLKFCSCNIILIVRLYWDNFANNKKAFPKNHIVLINSCHPPVILIATFTN